MSLIPSWRVTDAQPGRVVAPDERLPWGSTIALGAQHVIAMFGATVLAPLLMGFDPNVAILMSGVGTLIFFFVVGLVVLAITDTDEATRQASVPSIESSS